MASEAVLVKETELPISMKCSTTTAIEKGAILKMTSPMTAALADGDGDIIAGICAQEVLSTNSGYVSVYRRGIFRVLAGAANVTVGITLDTHAATGATNEVAPAPVTTGHRLGFAMETKGDGNTFLMELFPHHATANS